MLTTKFEDIQANRIVKKKQRAAKASAAGDPLPSSIKPPMGATDCLIVAIAMTLGWRLHPSPVLLVTSDQRQADVLQKCRQLSRKAKSDPKLKDLGLPEAAANLNQPWNNRLYPGPLHLAQAKEQEIVESLNGTWPPPSRDCKEVADCDALTERQQQQLKKVYFEVNDETKVSVDFLPSEDAVNTIQVRLADATGKVVPCQEIYQRLQRWRKAGLLKRRGLLFE